MTKLLAGLVALLLPLAAFLATPLVAQDHPETLGSLGEGRHAWVAASHFTDNHVDDWLVANLQHQIDGFARRFGSIEEQGLAEGDYPSAAFCTKPMVSVVGSPPIPEIMNLDGTLLLSEVAVTATVDEIIPGFSIFGGPSVLLALSDVVALTDRSPSPAYALMRIESMVINGSVFCDVDSSPDATFDYQPSIGDRVVVIGAWDKGVVEIGYLRTSLFGKIDGEVVDWYSWNVARPRPRAIDVLLGRIEALETQGLMASTLHLARQEYISSDRMEFADQLRHNTCPIANLTEIDGGQLIPSLICRETDR